ncbi:MAG: iron dependent repressor, metal binding and dimerization domain protein [Patescibacteria group bacterium]|nr:iron dependent repressor, metal binding and dimerization domain protein [Patescibacteria group bacterium]
MTEQKEINIIRIVKEDILRILQEQKEKKASIQFIDLEIDVSNLFFQRAISELKKENLIKCFKSYIFLTEDGKNDAQKITKKHLILKKYFKSTRDSEEAYKMAHILEHYVSEQVIRNIEKLSTFKEKNLGIILTKLKANIEYLISDIIIPRGGLFERIVSMGIFPGENIKIANNISNGVIIKIKNKKIALDKNIAEKIKALKI